MCMNLSVHNGMRCSVALLCSKNDALMQCDTLLIFSLRTSLYYTIMIHMKVNQDMGERAETPLYLSLNHGKGWVIEQYSMYYHANSDMYRLEPKRNFYMQLFHMYKCMYMSGVCSHTSTRSDEPAFCRWVMPLWCEQYQADQAKPYYYESIRNSMHGRLI